MTRSIVAVLALGSLGTTTAGAAAAPEERCLAALSKAAGKYSQCIQNVIGRTYLAATTGNSLPNTTAFGRCVTKYAATWDHLQARAVVWPGVQTCEAPRWVDNGDGTVTDKLTGLQWEKKTSDATIHDKDNVYSWTISDTAADGSAFMAFLPTLNGAGFAGQNDWRLPTLAELASIMSPPYPLCTSSPCIDAAFGPMGSYTAYWSSTSDQITPQYAWFVIFENGFPVSGPKIISSNTAARAVRGGL